MSKTTALNIQNANTLVRLLENVVTDAEYNHSELFHGPMCAAGHAYREAGLFLVPDPQRPQSFLARLFRRPVNAIPYDRGDIDYAVAPFTREVFGGSLSVTLWNQVFANSAFQGVPASEVTRQMVIDRLKTVIAAA